MKQILSKNPVQHINNFLIDLTFFCRKFTKEFKVPEGVLKEQLQSSYSSEGILTIHAPRKINAPEGAEVQEAMASASKAFTTDDGKNLRHWRDYLVGFNGLS